MRLVDLIADIRIYKAKEAISRRSNGRLAATSNGSHEIDALMRADASGLVLDCPLLAREEIDIAHLILDRLTQQKDYVPSDLVLQFIRGVNARIEMSLSDRLA